MLAQVPINEKTRHRARIVDDEDNVIGTDVPMQEVGIEPRLFVTYTEISVSAQKRGCKNGPRTTPLIIVTSCFEFA